MLRSTRKCHAEYLNDLRPRLAASPCQDAAVTKHAGDEHAQRHPASATPSGKQVKAVCRRLSQLWPPSHKSRHRRRIYIDAAGSHMSPCCILQRVWHRRHCGLLFGMRAVAASSMFAMSNPDRDQRHPWSQQLCAHHCWMPKSGSGGWRVAASKYALFSVLPTLQPARLRVEGHIYESAGELVFCVQ